MSQPQPRTLSDGDSVMADPDRWEDFLTAEQRLDLIAEILATLTLRAMNRVRK